MKKIHYYILICALLIITIALTIVVILRGDKNSDEQISEELRAAKEVFDIKLNNDKTEYFIYRLKTKKNVSGSTIVIPDTIDNIPVTKIIDPENDFASFSNIASIKIGKNIKYIGKNGYNISEELPYGENIFLSSNSLVSIDVDSDNLIYSSVEGVLYNKDQSVLIRYPSSKNKGLNQALHSYTVLDSVKRIYPNAFSNNLFLQSVVIPNSVEIIDKKAFSGCQELFNIVMNEGLLRIEHEAFSSCKNIDTITLPNTIKHISSGAFKNCDKLTTLYVNSKLEFVGINLFTGSNKMTSIFVETKNYDNLVNLFRDASLNISLIKEIKS